MHIASIGITLMELPMQQSYRVYDARANRVEVVPAERMSAYDRWMADESDRQAYRSNRR
jgi:hypothetical protein